MSPSRPLIWPTLALTQFYRTRRLEYIIINLEYDVRVDSSLLDLT